jgi:hypothetical protein
MHLVRLFLPLQDNVGQAFPPGHYREIEQDLAGRFGGVTAHLEAPASGRWRDGGENHDDEIVIFEIVVPDADRSWWSSYRGQLEERFRQKRVLVTLQQIEIL